MILYYASIAWSLNAQAHKILLQMVECKAAHYVFILSPKHPKGFAQYTVLQLKFSLILMELLCCRSNHPPFITL